MWQVSQWRKCLGNLPETSVVLGVDQTPENPVLEILRGRWASHSGHGGDGIAYYVVVYTVKPHNRKQHTS